MWRAEERENERGKWEDVCEERKHVHEIG